MISEGYIYVYMERFTCTDALKVEHTRKDSILTASDDQWDALTIDLRAVYWNAIHVYNQ